MFEIRNASKKFGEEFALKNVTMDIGSGMNFIIGASGSGKTTLLKIISGMEQDFEGDAFYCGKSIKELTQQEKSYYYNNIFGFVWQDFNLLESLTVFENVMLAGYLKQDVDKKAVIKVLRELKISELANQKVRNLSGGQKQRVAIARELVKNPQVIIADEPTSALDEASAKNTMAILRDISKTRTVIVVTHDTSLIDAKSKVYELDKGELISCAEPAKKSVPKVFEGMPHKLAFDGANKIAVCNTKSKPARFIATTVSLLIAATLLLVTLSGSINDSSQATFDKLYETYGESFLDISLVSSFTSAGATSGNEKDEPNADVSQNIDGFYEKYKADDRVDHVVFMQAFNEIKVTVDGKEYQVESSGNSPVLNKMVTGVMPVDKENEVAVPESFVKKMGLKNEEALGKTVQFDAAIYNWDSGEPVLVPVKTTAKIVGVVDSTVKYEYEGQMSEYYIDDSFFFCKSAVDEMRAQANVTKSSPGFTIRAKSPADMIAIKDELNAGGIVPLGRFELVEDMVRLSSQTQEQSSAAIAVIGVLSVVVILAVSLFTALTRKREYAIYKVSGFSKGHLFMVTTLEFVHAAVAGGALFLCLSPLINIATKAFWGVNILNVKLLGAGVVLVIIMGVISCIVTAIISSKVKASASLKTGDR